MRTGIAMPLIVTATGASDVGLVRGDNEDRWLLDVPSGLFIVADGMGGAEAGEVAAQLVIDRLPLAMASRWAALDDVSRPQAAEAMADALRHVNDEADQYANAHPETQGMGSTAVVLLVHGNRALVGHAGDSRAYLLRGGKLERLTEDHATRQGRLTQCIGTYGPIEPTARAIELSDGDRVLLCSDGLTSMVDDEMIARLLAHPDLQGACDALIQAAKAAGGIDNITVIVTQATED